MKRASKNREALAGAAGAADLIAIERDLADAAAVVAVAAAVETAAAETEGRDAISSWQSLVGSNEIQCFLLPTAD